LHFARSPSIFTRISIARSISGPHAPDKVMLIRAFLIALFFTLAAAPGFARADTAATNPAQPGSQDEAAQAKKYQACMKQAQKTPKAALKQAMEWEKAGGGDAARHCVAASYMGLKQYDDAAMELERIAQTMPQVKAPLMAQLFLQAADEHQSARSCPQ
jgi:hypothetical protein